MIFMIAVRSLLFALLVVSLVGPVTAAESPEATALAVLASDAGLHEKARACQELAVFGGPADVPALAALLDQEHLADYARSGLEAIQDPAAGKALRKALRKALCGLNGRLLAVVVNSLGVRREIAAVPDLQRLALDAQRGVGGRGRRQACDAPAEVASAATPPASKPIIVDLRVSCRDSSAPPASRIHPGSEPQACVVADMPA
jgi:hypothetical protein